MSERSLIANSGYEPIFASEMLTPMTGSPTPPLRKLPRDEAGSFELKGGTGEAVASCTLDDFLEVYKVDATFRVKTPDCVDPDRTNPAAPWVITTHDNVGSGNAVVARVLLQGRDVVDAIGCRSERQKAYVIQALHGCKEALVVCERVAQSVAGRIDGVIHEIERGDVKRDRRTGAINPLPQVSGLESDAATFLIHSKRAIREICRLPGIILDFPTTDTNFEHLAKTLSQRVGSAEEITTFAQQVAPGVKHLIDLRNFQEHPGATRTVVENFGVTPTSSVTPPTWCVEGRRPVPIREEIVKAVSFLIEVAEWTLILAMVHGATNRRLYVIDEIEASAVDPKIPIRYRVSLDLSQLTLESRLPPTPDSKSNAQEPS